jgi:hypothetical protein
MTISVQHAEEKEFYVLLKNVRKSVRVVKVLE